MCHSPQLIAACHVLHRRLVPRHSPCALSNLTYSIKFSISADFKAMVLLLTSNYPKHILNEKILLESKTRYLPVPIKLVLQIARPFKNSRLSSLLSCY